ncbi:MAG: class I SAM-dependent methyltransferase [Bacteroidia bacterium]
MVTKENQYYKQVGDYYDDDAPEFEKRYWKNPVLQRIRIDFRNYVHKLEFKNALEIGFGSGLDLAHFARCYPEKEFYGIDVSQGMVNSALAKKQKHQLQNLSIAKGSVEDVSQAFNNTKFDLIYVFFGALNTVENLELVAKELNKLLAPNGKMVLTFVNKWYLQGMAIEFFKLRWDAAFGRLKKVWGGYSPTRHLSSVCYSPAQISRIFKNNNILQKQGYSITHPAWYYIRFNIWLRPKGRWLLWKTDKWLNRTLAWKWGEYALYTMNKKSN